MGSILIFQHDQPLNEPDLLKPDNQAFRASSDPLQCACINISIQDHGNEKLSPPK